MDFAKAALIVKLQLLSETVIAWSSLKSEF